MTGLQALKWVLTISERRHKPTKKLTIAHLLNLVRIAEEKQTHELLRRAWEMDAKRFHATASHDERISYQLLVRYVAKLEKQERTNKILKAKFADIVNVILP